VVTILLTGGVEIGQRDPMVAAQHGLRLLVTRPTFATGVSSAPGFGSRGLRQRRPQAVLNKRIKEIAETRVRYGYRRIHVLLRREGWRVNAKRVWRLYREMGLQLHVWRQSEASEFPLPARWSW